MLISWYFILFFASICEIIFGIVYNGNIITITILAISMSINLIWNIINTVLFWKKEKYDNGFENFEK